MCNIKELIKLRWLLCIDKKKTHDGQSKQRETFQRKEEVVVDVPRSPLPRESLPP